MAEFFLTFGSQQALSSVQMTLLMLNVHGSYRYDGSNALDVCRSAALGVHRLGGTMQQKGAIQIIEWEDLDKRKFYSLGVFMTLTTRATVYPASLIRTRLQVQKGKTLYTGTFDAFCKILRTEGVQGLYRGFMVNTFTLVSGQAYITTYELVRKYVSQYSPSNTVKSIVAGGAASLVAQTITVPIDVVSQHLMMQGQGEHQTRFKAKPKMMLAATKRRMTFGQTRDISVQIFAADGFRGFYRGYVASLLTYIPNSALWWPFYHFYAGKSIHNSLKLTVF